MTTIQDELTGKIGLRPASEQRIFRLESSWHLPEALNAVGWQVTQSYQSFCEEDEFSWASDWARFTGNVVHQWLQRIAEDGLEHWNTGRIMRLQDQFRQNLITEGMLGHSKEMGYAIERITHALVNAIRDKRGRWILRTRESACNEL